MLKSAIPSPPLFPVKCRLSRPLRSRDWTGQASPIRGCVTIRSTEQIWTFLCHSCGGRNPEVIDISGFRISSRLAGLVRNDDIL